MSWIQFYDTEREEFPDFERKVISEKCVIQITNKLVRHFKLKRLKIFFDKRYINPTYFQYATFPDDYMNSITFSASNKYPTTIGDIIHELAHHTEACHGKNSKHTKKLLAIERRMFCYCIKHNFWGMTKPLLSCNDIKKV